MRIRNKSEARARLAEVRKQLHNGASLDEACRRTGQRGDEYLQWEKSQGWRGDRRVGPRTLSRPRTDRTSR